MKTPRHCNHVDPAFLDSTNLYLQQRASDAMTSPHSVSETLSPSPPIFYINYKKELVLYKIKIVIMLTAILFLKHPKCAAEGSCEGNVPSIPLSVPFSF